MACSVSLKVRPTPKYDNAILTKLLSKWYHLANSQLGVGLAFNTDMLYLSFPNVQLPIVNVRTPDAK